MDFIHFLFDTTYWPPRWHCGHWTEALGWTHIISDLAIFGAYIAIPLILGYFCYVRKDLPFYKIFVLFGLFIVFCGTGHLIEAIIFWHPIYRFDGLIKVSTAIVSWGTVIAFIPTIPRVLNLPKLQMINEQLQSSLTQTKQHKEMQQALTTVLAEGHSFDAAAPTILKLFCERMEWNVGLLWKVNKTSNAMSCTSYYQSENSLPIKDFVEECLKITTSPGIDLPGFLWMNKESYFIKDISASDFFLRTPLAVKANLHNAYAFPILIDREVIGVIEFFSHKNSYYDENLLKMLNEISYLIGLSIAKDNIQQKNTELNQQLTYAARKAGMEEVATSVLHNVGNVLTSVNVSVNLLREGFRNSKITDFINVAKLIQEHENDLDIFLKNDSKGKLLPKYLLKLAECWQMEYEAAFEEIGSLANNVDHIKKVVKMQQMLSRSVEIVETISITELLEESLSLNAFACEHSNITIEKEYMYRPILTLDRIKLLQIFVNIIRNAIDSLIEHPIERKVLTLRVGIKDEETIEVQIADNGVGIDPQHLVKIFSYGFTTKKEGHGFGLHASSIAIQEMGGELKASSQGLGKGAIFTLTIPYNVKPQAKTPTPIEDRKK